MRTTQTDIQDFKQYLKQCTDAQVQGVYDKERKAQRRVYTQLAIEEALNRGITLHA